MGILKKIGLILCFLAIPTLTCYGSFDMQIKVEQEIEADTEVSTPPQIAEVMPVGHFLSPTAYHLHIQTEKYSMVYVINMAKRVFKGKSNGDGDTWIQVDLSEDNENFLKILAIDYFGNSSLSEVTVIKQIDTQNFVLNYTLLGKADNEVKELAVELASAEEEPVQEQLAEFIEVAKLPENDPHSVSSLRAAAEPMLAKINTPYGYVSLAMGSIFIIVGLYFRSTPLPPSHNKF